MPGRRTPTPRRYAQAVFALALEQGQLDRWLQDLQTMMDITRSQGVVELLESPGLKLPDKLEAIRNVLPDLSAQAANLMALLAHQGSLRELPRIQAAFRQMVDQHEGRVRATVTTAVPLSQTEQQQVAARLKELWEKEVVVETHVEPSIIGGILVRAGDLVIDGSTRGRLQALRKTIREQAL